MYESHFGITAPPFQLSPDSSFYSDSRGHHTALDAVRRGLAEPPDLVQCDRQPDPHDANFGSSYGMLGMAHWVGAPDFDAIVETHAARMAASTRHGLVLVLRSMAEKLKVRPELFGIYPRVDLSLAQAKRVSRSNACAPAITSAPAQAEHCAAAPRRCRRGEARKLAFTNVRWWPGP